jgi:hypothetical protein
MNNKNLNTLYGGNFNNIQNMLAEDVSDTSDYNVSLLNQLHNDKSGGFGFSSLGNLAKLAAKATSVINKGEKLASQASKVINKVESSAAKTTSFVDKIQGNNNENKVNNCITIAQTMSSDELKVVITQLQKILAGKK